MHRVHCPVELRVDQVLSLPPDAVRHLQVLRLQPGDRITLFGGLPTSGNSDSSDSSNLEFDAVIESIGRREIRVQVGQRARISREASLAVHLVIGVPAADRMDWLVEKATELGAASIQPVFTERSVLRLSADRAEKKLRHWQAIAASACEQCGRNTVPKLHDPCDLGIWLRQAVDYGSNHLRWLLSPQAPAGSLESARRELLASRATLTALSGPEGGLTSNEEQACQAAGFVPVQLGARVLRAETAPLALLANLTLSR